MVKVLNGIYTANKPGYLNKFNENTYFTLLNFMCSKIRLFVMFKIGKLIEDRYFTYKLYIFKIYV